MRRIVREVEKKRLPRLARLIDEFEAESGPQVRRVPVLRQARVVVFDGDGSLLMNLGSLVTIANQAPKNYVHCLCENGCYETNGSVPIPRAGQIRFAELAKGAGYRKTYEISELAEWERLLPQILKEEGPLFVDLKVEAGDEAYPENFARLYSFEYREKFRQALAKS